MDPAKIQSLTTDQIKIINAIAVLTGEIGKADVFIRHATYELDRTDITQEATLNNFMDTKFAKAFISSINSGKLNALSLVESAKPQNSELNDVYQSLITLQQLYLSCCNAIASTSSPNQYRTSINNSINAFNSHLSSINLADFMVSDYTADNKDQAYAYLLNSTQTDLNDAANNLSAVYSAISKLSEIKFETAAFTTLENNVNSYIIAASSAGKINAYRIIMLGFQSKYSGAYSNITAGYDAITRIYNILTDIKMQDSLSNFNTSISNYISTIRSSANNISSAVK